MGEFTLVVAAIASGLSAGLFYGWRVSVIPGTAQTSAAAYVETMQRVNVAIINPAFLVVFMGVPVLVGLAAVVQFADDDTTAGTLLAVAVVVYLTTTVATTATRNIPLNDALDAFDLTGASPEDVEAERARYERPWNRWHDVRTVSSVVAFVLVVVAAVVRGG
ncbi:MAG: anthrone oxygenase family protein [Actinomycetota bacterium]